MTTLTESVLGEAALATYAESGGTGRTAIDEDEAVAVMLEKHEVCCALFHGCDWSKRTTNTTSERVVLFPAAQVNEELIELAKQMR